jgi:hypothetical protein
MLAKLAKIANRLDSLGLTKEADILDAYILKVADETVFADNRELVSSDIANNINNELPGISKDKFITEFVRRFSGSTAKPAMDSHGLWSPDAARHMAIKHWDLLQSNVSPSDKSNVSPTGWEKYVSTTGAMGQKVKEAWSRYTRSGAAGVNPTFSSFTSWYNGQMKGAWGGKHKMPSEVVGILNSLSSSPSAIAESDRSWEELESNPWRIPGGAGVASSSGSKTTSEPQATRVPPRVPTSSDMFKALGDTAQQKIDQNLEEGYRNLFTEKNSKK